MAIEAIYINKKRAPDPLSFKALVEEGIQISQTLSAHEWTDYNTHDPGVTTLEQLCYVLSDIAYRCDYPVLDYLSQAKQNFSLEAVSLYPSEVILQPHPGNINDLIRLFKTHIIEIENISVASATTNAVATSLYDIYVNFDPIFLSTNNLHIETALLQNIVECYANNRSLNENLCNVILKRTHKLILCADIIIDSAYTASQTLAAIYIEVYKKLAELQDTELETEQNTTDSTEQLTEQKQQETNIHLAASDLYAAIMNVNNVSAIQSISFIDEHGHSVQQLSFNKLGDTIRLHLPQNEQEFHISLHTGNKRLPLHYGRFASEYFQLASEYKQQKAAKYKPQSKALFPNVFDRQVTQYTSVTEHFPANYKLRRGQMPSHANKQEYAQNLQFKGYLGMFDQLLSNQTHTLGYINQLFAPIRSTVNAAGNIDISGLQPHSQVLLSEQLDNLAQIVGPHYAQQLHNIDRQHHRFEEHASKVLDYFLALYGESMNQNSLSMFTKCETQQALAGHELSNKIRMLQHIQAITKNRLKGINLQNPVKSPAQLSGLHLKVAVLLGFNNLSMRQLHKLQPNDNGLHVIEHGLLGQFITHSDCQNQYISARFFQHQVSVVFPDYTELSAKPEFRTLACETVMLSCPAHIFAHVLFLNKAQMRKLDTAYSAWIKSFQLPKQEGQEQRQLALDVARLLSRYMHAGGELSYDIS